MLQWRGFADVTKVPIQLILSVSGAAGLAIVLSSLWVFPSWLPSPWLSRLPQLHRIINNTWNNNNDKLFNLIINLSMYLSIIHPFIHLSINQSVNQPIIPPVVLLCWLSPNWFNHLSEDLNAPVFHHYVQLAFHQCALYNVVLSPITMLASFQTCCIFMPVPLTIYPSRKHLLHYCWMLGIIWGIPQETRLTSPCIHGAWVTNSETLFSIGYRPLLLALEEEGCLTISTISTTQC